MKFLLQVFSFHVEPEAVLVVIADQRNFLTRKNFGGSNGVVDGLHPMVSPRLKENKIFKYLKN